MNTVIVSTLIAVLNSLWQAALLTVLVWLALRFAPRMNAATRFVIWWATLAVVLILPVAPRFIASARDWFKPSPIPSTRPLYISPATPTPVINLAPLVTVEQRETSRWPLWVAGVWAAILLYRLTQIGRSYLYLRSLKRRAVVSEYPLPPTRRPVRFLLSSDIDSPIAVGFARPAVILPRSLPSELSKEEMEHVLLHESAHLARCDDWTNLFGRILDGALALHPVALWILRRIEIEREAACDDWVVARTQAARPYAQSLARLYELRLARRQAASGELLAAGIFGRGSRFGERIESLLRRERNFVPRASVKRVAAGMITLLICAAAASLLPRWIAAQTNPAFDVASIKMNLSGTEGFSVDPMAHGTFTARNLTLMRLITTAYRLQNAQVIGVPNWGNSERYDVSAKGADTTGRLEILSMVQTLLATRFHLSVHTETRTLPIFALVVAKNGTKLQRPGGICATASPDSPQCNSVSEFKNGLASASVTMPIVARTLGRILGRVVVDQTGLSGSFTIGVMWKDENLTPNPGEEKGGMDAPASPSTALEEQAGLKLQATRGEVEVLLIDHVEHPTEN